MSHRVVLATRNQHKVAELRRILAPSGLDVDLVGAESFPVGHGHFTHSGMVG
jgi:XTP/dITP diphosphohydrolase